MVESNGFTRVRLANCLADVGFEVACAPNGRLALAKLGIFKPDTLVLEINLRGTSGLQLIKRARQMPDLASRPIYVFTSAASLPRWTRKELAALDVRVYDKMTTPEEGLARQVAAQVIGCDRASTGLPEAVTVSPEPTEPAPTADTGIQFDEPEEPVPDLANPEECVECCARLRDKVQSVLSAASVDRLPALSPQAKALLGFLEHLSGHPQDMSATALETVHEGLHTLTGMAGQSEPVKDASFNVVVIDESPASREAIIRALESANIYPVSFSDPEQARHHLATTSADLVVASLSAEKQEDFESVALRNHEFHQETPLLFVPPPTAPECPASGTIADEAIAKPQPAIAMQTVIQALNVLHERSKGATEARRAEAAERPGERPDEQASSSTAVSENTPACTGVGAQPDQPAGTLDIEGSVEIPSAEPQPAVASPGFCAEADLAAHAPCEPAPASELHTTTINARATINDPTASDPGPATEPETDHAREREALVMRIYDTERELHHQLDQIARRDRIIQHLRKELETLTAEAEVRMHPERSSTVAVEETAGSGAESAVAQLAALHLQLESVTAEHQAALARCQQADHDLAELQQELRARCEQESGLRSQLAAAKAEQQFAQARCDELAHHQQQAETALRAALADSEERARQSSDLLARTEAELEQERTVRLQWERDNAALASSLQALHAEANRTLATDRANRQRIAALEDQLCTQGDSLASLKAELQLEQEQRLELQKHCDKTTTLNRQLRRTNASISGVHETMLSTHEEIQDRLAAGLLRLNETEQKMHSLAGELQRSQDELQTAQRTVQAQAQAIERKDAELKEASREATERSRLIDALRAALSESQFRYEQARLELSRAQVAMQTEQVERRRLQTHLLRLQQTTINSARAARTFRNTLRKQIGDPAEELLQSTRRLLRLDLGAEQKEHAEAILQHGLLVNERLRESQPAAAPGAGGQSTVQK